MSATPISSPADLQWTTISSDTPEGQQLIRMLELDAALKASGSGEHVGLTTLALPTDPNLLEQWHLVNVGQVVNYGDFQEIFGSPGEDINVAPVWDRDITGQGILVAVVDSGVQVAHPDLEDNISIEFAYNAITGGTNVGPSLTDAESAHGTAVAGLIGAVANNGEGGVGVAYGATIVPIKFGDASGVGGPNPELAFINAVVANGAPIDIYNHSWGPFDPENPRAASGPTQAELITLIDSATTGRFGLGAIHVFSSGNNAGPQFSPGFQDIGFLDTLGSNGYANSRYVISVGAIDHDSWLSDDGDILNSDGSVTLYGEAGTALLVVAPTASGPFDLASNVASGSGIFTTDTTGSLSDPYAGINIPPLPNGTSLDVDQFPNTDYTTRFGGTSAAAPLVSGVIALMLEADRIANGGVSTLTYRDVQEILVRSARQNDPNDPSWIVNVTPFFSDPIRHDPSDPTYDEGEGSPSADPNSTEIENAPNDEIIYIIVPGAGEDDPPELARAPGYEGYSPVSGPLSQFHPAPLATNGAGYTVSHGWLNDLSAEYGFGHGVVDADLAVQLASQWNLKDQSLSPERTVVQLLHAGHTIKAAEVSEGTDAPGDESLVPGAVYIPGIVGQAGSFINYFQEFFKEPSIMEGEEGDPDADPPVEPTEDSFDVPTMPFRGDPPVPGNNRGTFYLAEGPQNMSLEWVELQLDISYGDANALDFLRITLVSPDGTQSELTHYQYPGDYDFPGGNQQYFRGTNYVPDPLGVFYQTIDPPGVLDADLDGNGTFEWKYTSNRHWGERADGLWQIRFENYSGEDLQLGDMRIFFHGRDVGIPGADAARYLGFVDDTGGYLGHGSNVTVYVKDEAGNRISQFITGADGNYYFDVGGPGLTLGVDVPEGYELIGPAEVPLINGHHFTIRPLAPEVTLVNFTGVVWADLDGDGVRDDTDAGLEGFIVYADLNHTGQFESTEPNVLTIEHGEYTLPMQVTEATLITIGVKPPPGWQATNPDTGFQGKLASPNSGTIGDVDFGVQPPSDPTGQGNATIIGFVYSDRNGDGQRQALSEPGLAQVTVFLDEDLDGSLGPGEIYTTTDDFGAYAFGDVAIGDVRIDVVVDDPLVLTAPMAGYRDLTLGFGEVSDGNDFGVQNLATDDFGDLVSDDDGYNTYGPNAASHVVLPGVYLGPSLDAERRSGVLIPDPGNPGQYLPDETKHGVGDDQEISEASFDDEDGIRTEGSEFKYTDAQGGVHYTLGELGSPNGKLQPGVTNFVELSLAGVGGFLNVWMDFDQSGTFDAGEHVVVDADLNPGTRTVEFMVPVGLPPGPIAARFRWGTFGLDSFGPAPIGEVEDWLLANNASPLTILVAGDYNRNGTVDYADYLVWKSVWGTNNPVADGNNDGAVNAADYTVWRDHYGQTASEQGSGGGSMAALTSPSSEDGETSTANAALLDATPTAVSAGATETSSGNDAAATESAASSRSARPAARPASRRVAVLPFTATVTPRTTESALRRSVAVANTTDADLLVLDHVLSQIAPLREDDHDDDALPRDDSSDGEDQSELDLALAAAFDEEIDWRLGL